MYTFITYYTGTSTYIYKSELRNFWILYCRSLFSVNVIEFENFILALFISDWLMAISSISAQLTAKTYFFGTGCYYLYQADNKVHKSSSICIYYQCGMQDTLPNMLLELLVQIVSEPCFNILRTKEQLGKDSHNNSLKFHLTQILTQSQTTVTKKPTHLNINSLKQLFQGTNSFKHKLS